MRAWKIIEVESDRGVCDGCCFDTWDGCEAKTIGLDCTPDTILSLEEEDETDSSS